MGRVATSASVLATVCLVAGAAFADPAELVAAAIERTRHVVVYDGSYQRLDYPGGDVPADRGVCTDLVIRAYRQLGFDLQQAVHEDMTRAFSAYPSERIWGLTRPDANIDHRRVPNLATFFERHGARLSPGTKPGDFQPGDLVTWRLPGNVPHIGIVVDRYAEDGTTPLVAHNIGAGPKLDDMLFLFPITGQFRFVP